MDTASLALPHFESFKESLPMTHTRQTSNLTHSATSLHHYSYSQQHLSPYHNHHHNHQQQQPMSPVSSASPSPKPMLKRKPLVHDEVHSSPSALPSAAAVAAFAAADVLDGMNDSDATPFHYRHRSLSHPHPPPPPLYHHSLFSPHHQRQSSCSSVFSSSSSSSPMIMRRQRVPSRGQTPPRQRQLSGSSTCSSSSFAWPSFSTPGSTCPSLIPSAAPSPMATSSFLDLPSNSGSPISSASGQRKRSRTISHLDRALKEETLMPPLPPSTLSGSFMASPRTRRQDSRSPSVESSSSATTAVASDDDDEAATPPPASLLASFSDTRVRQSTLDDLVYAISLDEDLTANVKQAMATMDRLVVVSPPLAEDDADKKVDQQTPCAVPAVKVTCPAVSMPMPVALPPIASPKATAATSNTSRRRRMTMACPGESNPHGLRVVYFAPGCVDDHLAKARAHEH